MYTYTRACIDIHIHTYIHVYVCICTTFLKSIHPSVDTYVVIIGFSVISWLAEDDPVGQAV